MIQDWLSISPHSLVIHFENLTASPESRSRELNRVLAHMGLGDDAEMQERVDCLGQVEVGGHHKREGRPEIPQSVFEAGKLADAFDAAIDEAQRILLTHGQEPIPTHRYKFYQGGKENTLP